MSPLTLPTYENEKFKNRELEINAVKKAIKRIHEGEKTSRKVIIFSGGRGHGKTWLMAHLHRSILKEISYAKSFFIRLYNTSTIENIDKPSEYQAEIDNLFIDGEKTQKIEKQISEIYQKINLSMQATYVEGASNYELATWLVSHLKQEEDKVFVILVDSVFESDWDLLEQLEKSLLDPLSDLPNILFIFSGRGPVYPWISPNLKVDTEALYELGAFENSGESLKLLENPTKPRGISDSKIVEISGGYPSNLALLAQLESASNLAECLDKMIKNHLEIIPATYPDRDKIRGRLEAISILQEGFREEELDALLECYQTYRSEPAQEDALRKIRINLQETHLVSWEKKGYFINESVRCILEAFLKEKHPDLWQALHQRAYELYMAWAKQYEKHSVHFETLANTHKEIIDNYKKSITPKDTQTPKCIVTNDCEELTNYSQIDNQCAEEDNITSTDTPTSSYVVAENNQQFTYPSQINNFCEEEENHVLQVVC